MPDAAVTAMHDHVARFWRHLETEHVHIVVNLKRAIGADAPAPPRQGVVPMIGVLSTGRAPEWVRGGINKHLCKRNIRRKKCAKDQELRGPPNLAPRPSIT